MSRGRAIAFALLLVSLVILWLIVDGDGTSDATSTRQLATALRNAGLGCERYRTGRAPAVLATGVSDFARCTISDVPSALMVFDSEAALDAAIAASPGHSLLRGPCDDPRNSLTEVAIVRGSRWMIEPTTDSYEAARAVARSIAEELGAGVQTIDCQTTA